MRVGKLLVFIVISCVAFSSIKEISTTDYKLQILKVFDLLENKYVEKNVGNQQLVHAAIKGMIDSLDDPYTRFLEPKNYEEMKVNLQGEFFGIGIHIGIKDNWLTVISTIEGTPASKVGLRSMDKIVSIDNKSTVGLSLEEAVSKIRGEKNTTVLFGIQRKGVSNNLEFAIVRDSIEIRNVGQIEIITKDVGYFRIISFESKNTPVEVKDAIVKLEKEGMKRLILDVRNNGGGLLSNALDIGGIFMGKKTIVYTVDRNDERKSLTSSNGNQFFNGPIVVLVNGASASASEILAGAIRDNKRGILMGTTTFGKASVQNIIPLIDESAMLLTIAKYLTPNGDNIHKVGITPDIIVNIPTADIELIKNGEYEYALTKDFQVQEAVRFLLKK